MNQIYLLFILFLISIHYIDFRVSSGILILIYIFNEYKNIKETIQNELKIPEDSENPIPNYKNDLSNYLSQLKHYKDHNILNYNQGLKYWNLFIQHINKLDRDKDFSNKYDNTIFYLHQSLNNFLSITVTDNMSMNDINKLSTIIKNIYRECYILLHMISKKLNDHWKKKPNLHNKQIDLSTIHNINDYNTRFDIYG
jgi:hypothetical protein